MNSNEVTILASAIGVIGTLLGTILGWILNSISNRGKINVVDAKWEEKYYKEYSDEGFVTTKEDYENADNYEFNVCLSFYNSSNVTKIIRNILIEFYCNKKFVFECCPYDKAYEKIVSMRWNHYEVEPINIASKTILKFNLYNFISLEKDIDIKGVNKIYLTFIDENNKKRKFKLRDRIAK